MVHWIRTLSYASDGEPRRVVWGETRRQRHRARRPTSWRIAQTSGFHLVAHVLPPTRFLSFPSTPCFLRRSASSCSHISRSTSSCVFHFPGRRSARSRDPSLTSFGATEILV